MRILAILVVATILSGCTAMLVGGSAESGTRQDCSESDKEADKRGCK